ncbi:MAG: hypothetical protein Q8T11_01135 [Elusimicrobiota bacterium]|nr:hypothetical protein [Elusimicrobiota bacterium]
MRKDYAAAWLGIFSCLGLWFFWSLYGSAYVRRTYLAAASFAESSRTQSQFVAVLLPRIRRKPERFVMSEAELTALLRGLKDAGHVTIGLDDVEGLYARGRKLPPKALLLAFSENDQRGFQLSDRALKRLGMRGVAFIQMTAEDAGQEHRQHLTRHAISQMRLGRAWEFGWTAKDAPPSASPWGGRAVLEVEISKAPPTDPKLYPLRFVAAELGLNDGRDDPRALRALALRTDRSPSDNLQIVTKTWPRASEHSDDFRGDGVGTDWIEGWGVVSMGQRRLALLSTPRHTSAGVFLRGTEKWRDAAVEFVLKKYQKEFWAYARLREAGGFVRVGARDGFWYVEQKAGPEAPVNMLARTQIAEGGLPARVRFVVKGGSVLVYINGRMQFGRALRLHPGVDHGQVFLGVYDAQSRTSLAVLTSVRAAPLGDVWITTQDDRRGEFDEDRLEALRDEAVYARALSPRWITVEPEGGVVLDERQSVLIRSMAGFYACRLVATADLTGVRASVLGRTAAADRLAGGLASAARELGSSGLNIRLRGDQASRPETLAFLGKVREGLRSRGELLVTVQGEEPLERALALVTDGVLRRSARTRQSLELLEAVYP